MRRILASSFGLGLGLALSLGCPSASAGDAVDLAALRRLFDDPDPAARAAAVRRLAGRLDEAAARLAVDRLSDPHPYVRRAAAGVLGTSVDPAVRARVLREAPQWRDPTSRREVGRAFALWADRDGRTGLLRALGDSDPSVRAEAARWLAEDPDAAATSALLVATSDRDGEVRATALDALVGRRAPPGAEGPAPAFARGLRDPDARVRLSALEGSVAAGTEAAVFAVLHGLDDAVWSVRLVAAESAGAVRDKRVLPRLVEALRDPRDRVAQAACGSLLRLTGIPFDADVTRWKAWLEGDGASFDPALVPERRTAGFDAGGRTVAAARFFDLVIPSAHVAFVLDASGSMKEPDAAGGTRWDRVRVEIDRVLEGLGTSAEGNVVLFGDAAEPLFPRAVRFTAAVRETVRARLLGRAPAGRTALYDGIAAALADPATDCVVVLSDGAPSAGAFFTKSDVRAEVRRANRWRRARIDVIGIGSDQTAKRFRSLLSDLAADSGGRLVTR
jgi:HEAT repeat protein